MDRHQLIRRIGYAGISLLCLVLLTGAGIQDMQRRVLKSRGGSACNVTSGLIGHWKFDGDSTDSSGNGFHGTPVGSPTFSAGKVGQALSLNGSSQYVSVADNATLDVTVVTLAAWINTSSATVYHRIIDKAYNAGYALFLEQTTGKGVASCNNQQALTASGIDTGGWVHLIATCNLTNGVAIYPNNGTPGTNANGVTITVNAHPFTIGANQSTAPNTEWFNGLIDDVRIYNLVLDSTERALIYNGGNGCP